jgi:hypothetical protein
MIMSPEQASPKKILHFEELWDKAESFSSSEPMDKVDIIQEVLMKVQVYQKLHDNQELAPADLKSVKSRLFGEILFSLTKLSQAESINVFAALAQTLSAKGQ